MRRLEATVESHNNGIVGNINEGAIIRAQVIRGAAKREKTGVSSGQPSPVQIEFCCLP